MSARLTKRVEPMEWGLPYASVDVDTMERICPACGHRSSEVYDRYGEQTTNAHGEHWEEVHGGEPVDRPGIVALVEEYAAGEGWDRVDDAWVGLIADEVLGQGYNHPGVKLVREEVARWAEEHRPGGRMEMPEVGFR